MTHGHAPLGERVIGIEIEQLRMIFRFCYINSREKSNGKPHSAMAIFVLRF